MRLLSDFLPGVFVFSSKSAGFIEIFMILLYIYNRCFSDKGRVEEWNFWKIRKWWYFFRKE